MLSFLKKVFTRKKRVKKFSTTLTDSREGVNSKRLLNSEINELLNKLDSKNIINNEELNKLIEFYFNKERIRPGIYKLNPDMASYLLFNINGVNTILDSETKDVVNIVLTMTEMANNVELNINVSVKDFHDFFKYVEIFGQKNQNSGAKKKC